MTDLIDHDDSVDHDDAGTSRDGDDDVVVRPSFSERRRLLRNLAVGGAGAAIGAIALSETAAAGDSEAPKEGVLTAALELGDDAVNTTDSATVVTYSGDDLDTTSVLSVGPDAPNEEDGNSVFPGAIGGYGKDAVPNGVHGSTVSTGGFGVVAANLAPAIDEVTDGAGVAPAALGIASVNGPQVRFVPLEGAVVGPTPGIHTSGELYVDAEGTLWFTVPIEGPVGDAVRFVKLAGTPTSGAFHFLEQPERLLDTREGAVKPAASSSTPVTVTSDDPESPLPAATTGVQLNVTAVRTENDGYFSVGRGDVTIPDDATFASGNWFASDQIINANVTSAVSTDGQIQVKLGPTGASHIVVDLVGYYL